MDDNLETTSLLQPTHNDSTFWRDAYALHGGAVLAFLRGRMGQGAEAEDLLQETFVRAIRAGSFQEGGNLRGYLLRTARNLAINRLRRPRLVVPAETSDERGEPLGEIADDSATSPEHNAQWSAFRARLEAALAGLKPNHRRAFELGVLEQLSYQEVTRLTGWSLALVKVNVHRARRQILAALGDSIPDFSTRRP